MLGHLLLIFLLLDVSLATTYNTSYYRTLYLSDPLANEFEEDHCTYYPYEDASVFTLPIYVTQGVIWHQLHTTTVTPAGAPITTPCLAVHATNGVLSIIRDVNCARESVTAAAYLRGSTFSDAVGNVYTPRGDGTWVSGSTVLSASEDIKTEFLAVRSLVTLSGAMTTQYTSYLLHTLNNGPCNGGNLIDDYPGTIFTVQDAFMRHFVYPKLHMTDYDYLSTMCAGTSTSTVDCNNFVARVASADTNGWTFADISQVYFIFKLAFAEDSPERLVLLMAAALADPTNSSMIRNIGYKGEYNNYLYMYAHNIITESDYGNYGPGAIMGGMFLLLNGHTECPTGFFLNPATKLLQAHCTPNNYDDAVRTVFDALPLIKEHLVRQYSGTREETGYRSNIFPEMFVQHGAIQSLGAEAYTWDVLALPAPSAGFNGVMGDLVLAPENTVRNTGRVLMYTCPGEALLDDRSGVCHSTCPGNIEPIKLQNNMISNVCMCRQLDVVHPVYGLSIYCNASGVDLSIDGTKVNFANHDNRTYSTNVFNIHSDGKHITTVTVGADGELPELHYLNSSADIILNGSSAQYPAQLVLNDIPIPTVTALGSDTYRFTAPAWHPVAATIGIQVREGSGEWVPVSAPVDVDTDIKVTAARGGALYARYVVTWSTADAPTTAGIHVMIAGVLPPAVRVTELPVAQILAAGVPGGPASIDSDGVIIAYTGSSIFAFQGHYSRVQVQTEEFGSIFKDLPGAAEAVVRGPPAARIGAPGKYHIRITTVTLVYNAETDKWSYDMTVGDSTLVSIAPPGAGNGSPSVVWHKPAGAKTCVPAPQTKVAAGPGLAVAAYCAASTTPEVLANLVVNTNMSFCAGDGSATWLVTPSQVQVPQAEISTLNAQSGIYAGAGAGAGVLVLAISLTMALSVQSVRPRRPCRGRCTTCECQFCGDHKPCAPLMVRLPHGMMNWSQNKQMQGFMTCHECSKTIIGSLDYWLTTEFELVTPSEAKTLAVADP